MNQEEKAKSISEFIKKIGELVEAEEDEENFIVYRGEPQVYPTSGQPGLFRKDYLKKDFYFEKNLLLEMKANKLSSGNNYLEMAIDAQHGGFPSRLLDVTYNSLIALYFACVSKPENCEKDKKEDGQVLLYKIKRAYCPTANNVIDNYKKILDNPKEMINEKIFECNHKFIDHIKVNSRIIAQQGALIMFPGLEWKPIPERNVRRIVIPKEYKKSIAEELEKYFGITTSFVYPEIDYSIEKITKRAHRIVSEDFSLKNELKMCFENHMNDIEYDLIQIASESNREVKVSRIRKLEKEIEAWKRDLISFIDNHYDNDKDKRVVILKYNSLISKYNDMFTYYINDNIKSCANELKMEEVINSEF